VAVRAARQRRRARLPPLRQQLRRLIVAVREGDEKTVEDAVLRLSSTRRIFGPLALIVGAFVMLFSGLRLLVTNWRLMLIQVLPAMLLWAVTIDLKAHVLHGKQFHIIHGPLLAVVFAAVILLTMAAFFLNASFAFAISRPGPPQLRTGFEEARSHAVAVVCWGGGTGVALAVAAVLGPRWGLRWYTVLLGIVLAFMLLCYVAVPARIVGLQADKTAKTAQSRRDKLAASAVSGAVGGIVCTPPYVIGRIGVVLLGSVFWLGVALLVIGLTLEAGATGAVKAIKVSAKLLIRQPQHHGPGGASTSVPDDDG
jgi:hypothetical protein